MTTALPPAPAFGAPIPGGSTPAVVDFLALRRSVSAVMLAEPAPSAAQVTDLLRIAARAPDHGKLTPWRFIVLRGQGKEAFAARLQAIAERRGDTLLASKLGKLKSPPLAIAVVSSPKSGAIPEWEQVLSAGAVCTILLQAALAMGFGANWITDWYSYDVEATETLGLAPGERVAGFMMMGTNLEPPLERERPDVAALVTDWTP
ncbi:MAG: nitroreductase [Phenylobacterium sp.]|nr:nitroreductase [Phenylobacterium sp.]